MTTLEASLFANQLGHFYESISHQIANYVSSNIRNLTTQQMVVLADDQKRMFLYANTFFNLSDKIAFAGGDDVFKQISSDTVNITNQLKTINNANKIIAIAGGLIGLAAAIAVPDNLAGIAQAVKTLGTAIATPLDNNSGNM